MFFKTIYNIQHWCHISIHWHHYFPPMRVLPHKHMLLRIVLLWRTQSTSYPQLSLVTVSGLCGRTGLDRMDCCVIDFNLESAACCSPSPTLFIGGTLLAPSRSLPPGDIPDYTATKNTSKQSRRSKVGFVSIVCGGGTFSFDPYSISIFPGICLYSKLLTATCSNNFHCSAFLNLQPSLSCTVSYLVEWTSTEVLYCWRLQVHRHQTFDAVVAAPID